MKPTPLCQLLRRFRATLAAGVLLSASASPAATAVFRPAADAEVVSNESADLRLGDASTMALQKGDGRDREIYLKFEVTGVEGTIASARLRIFVSKNQKGDPKTLVTIWSTAAGWEESTITYRNRPRPEKQVAAFSEVPAINTWMEAELTSAITGNGIYSFRLAAQEKFKLVVPSKEYRDADLQPVLEIIHGAGAVVATAASTARRELKRRAVLHPSHDAWVDGDASEHAAGTLVLRGSTSPCETYLAFDLPRLNCDVLSATLRFYYSGGGTPGAAVHAYATHNGWMPAALRWSSRPPPMPVQAIASARLPAGAGWIEFDAGNYLTGTGTYSFLLTTDSTTAATFASAEATANRPELVVIHQDGLNKLVPEVFASGERIIERYSDARLARGGILDVTKPPYCADPTGQRDATLALQRALNEGRDARCVTFLPPGTYLVSDTLEGISPMYLRGGIPGVSFRRREFGCVLKGPADPRQRPVIRLAPHAPGFGDPEKPKPVVHFWAVIGTPPNVYEKSNAHFSQQIMDVNVDLNGSAGNAGAIGVEFLACEDSSFQGVSVNASGAFAGIKDGLGSGGGMHDIAVTGGRYGAYLTNSQPTCSLSHATFTGQTIACVYNNSRGPLVMPGAVLAPAPGAHAVVLRAAAQGTPFNGSLCLVDSRIELAPDSTVPAITGNRSVYLNNVYAKNARVLVVIDGGGQVWTQPGNGGGWCQVKEYAGNAKVALERAQARDTAAARLDVMFVDHRRRESPLADIVLQVAERDIPADLQSRHTWTGQFPYHGSEGLLDTRDYGATGDGEREEFTDQHPALQRAIDDASARNRPLFLPRGVYRISRSLVLRANTTLVGASHLSTLILPIIEPVKYPQGDFLDGDRPQPLIRTVDDAAATTRLGLVGLYVTLPEAGQIAGERFATSYAVLWQAGRHSVIRAIKSVRSGNPRSAPSNDPFFVFRGSGGGKVFGFKVANSENMTPRFTNCLIDGTRAPISLYHFQPQGATDGACGAEIRQAENVDVFGLKYEGSKSVIHLKGSRNIRLFGESGGGAPKALFRAEDSRDFVITNIYPLRGKIVLGSRSSVQDADFETGDDHQVLLYKRGNPGRPSAEPPRAAAGGRE